MHGIILGGGVTGLAAGLASGWPVYEAAAVPGGICSSYYMRPGGSTRLSRAPADGEAYRFEKGGGHWIFGGDPAVLRLMRHLTPLKPYRRHSAVYFSDTGRIVPYPLQYHLAHLDEPVARQAAAEMSRSATPGAATMDAWLVARFGETLTERFFGPFHERYTAGLWTEVTAQDAYKSPLDLERVRQGVRGEPAEAGYNVRFVYPEEGLGTLAQKVAARCEVHYGRRAVHVDPERKVVGFADGTAVGYDVLISTLPLNTMMAMTGLAVADPPDPYTSVLVVNVGGVRGRRCPDHHWLYVPDAQGGYFRIGCYSNVDPAFLPQSARDTHGHVGFYVERAYPGGQKPSPEAIAAYAREVVRALQEDGFLEATDVVDPTWIDVAYTWARPGSSWRRDALDRLDALDIVMVGRYGRWVFQGIADSMRDGLMVGAALRHG